MNIIIVVCIYDRYENLRKWLHAWQQCEQLEAKLIFVNNIPEGATDVVFWREFCENKGAEYIERENIGFETGVIQDVITGKIEKEWDILFFFTDDTLPITKNFLPLYIEELKKPDVGVVCMEISGRYTPHVRTTGWCIKKEEADKLKFVSSSITKKEECYDFEHTGGENTLMSQILNMNKMVIQQSNIENSAVWDTHNSKINRWKEWHDTFPGYK